MFEFITSEWLCFLIAPLIALGVQWLKSSALVAQYPKLVAGLIAAIVSIVSGVTLGSLDVAMLIECTLVQFAGAVATYEVAIKPVNEFTL